jgi:hypothetical protein
MSDFGFLLLVAVPIILLALWAAFMLARRKSGGNLPPGREDSVERRELTGSEQHKHRRMP